MVKPDIIIHKQVAALLYNAEMWKTKRKKTCLGRVETKHAMALFQDLPCPKT